MDKVHLKERLCHMAVLRALAAAMEPMKVMELILVRASAKARELINQSAILTASEMV